MEGCSEAEGEWVITEGKCRGEIRSKAGEVTRVVGDAPTTDSLREVWSVRWMVMAAGKVEVM